jgi:large subunit ribosomal protein L23
MAILDFLKNKEEDKSKKPVKKPAKVSAFKKQIKKPEKKAEKTDVIVKIENTKVKNEKFSYEAIREPHISEKASYLAEKNQYIFEVSPNYNKHEIKKSVEGIYGVNVLSVNIIKIPAKKRRVGRTEGFRKAYKKAVIKIKNGQKIEIL